MFCRQFPLLENGENDMEGAGGLPCGLPRGLTGAAAFMREVRWVWGPVPAPHDWVHSWGLSFLVYKMNVVGPATPIRPDGRGMLKSQL